jgi:hypothetical protein
MASVDTFEIVAIDYEKIRACKALLPQRLTYCEILRRSALQARMAAYAKHAIVVYNSRDYQDDDIS